MYGLIFGFGTLLLLIGRRPVRYRILIVGGLFILVMADALTSVYARHYCCRYKAVDYEVSLKPFRKDFSEIPNHRVRDKFESADWVHDFHFSVGPHALNRPRAPGYQWHRKNEYSQYTTKLFKTYDKLMEAERHSILEKMKSGSADVVYVEPGIQMPDWFRQGESREGKGAKIEIIWYAPNEARLWVSSSAGTFLEMLDMYYPGWKAYLDGTEVPILRANFNSKGVFVPPGKHHVDFRFIPTSFIWCLLFSAFVFCAAMLKASLSGNIQAEKH
jgi:hypothetical protein